MNYGCGCCNTYTCKTHDIPEHKGKHHKRLGLELV